MSKPLGLLVVLVSLSAACGGGGGGGGGQRSFQGTSPVSITTAVVPDGIVGAAYSTQISAALGVPGTFGWSVTGGALPPGLTLAASGSPATTLSGQPTTQGSFTFTVQVTEAAGTSDSRSYTIDIGSAVTVSTQTLPKAVNGAPYQTTVTATAGSGEGYTWAVVAGALPTGVTLDASGTPSTGLSGTPSVDGIFSFTVEVTDSLGSTGTKQLTLEVFPPLQITTTSLRDPTVGTPYDEAIAATGGSGVYRWTRQGSGLLPLGLTFDVQGSPTTTMFGTPTATGSSTFTVRVIDDLGAFDDQTFSMTVNPAMAISTASPLTVAVQGSAYSADITAAGGTDSGFTWSISGGALPNGLQILAGPATPTTQVTGTSTQSGVFSFTVRVEDDNKGATTKAFSLTVNPPLEIVAPAAGALPDAIEGVAYNTGIAAREGTKTGYQWSVNGSLPAGLAITSAGTPKATISGVPSTPGTTGFTVVVTDDQGNVDVETYSITVDAAPNDLALETRVLPAAFATSTAPYTRAITAVGGAPPYSFTVTAGALPQGITLGSDGMFSGFTTSTGIFFFDVQVTDTAPTSVTSTYSLQVIRGEQRFLSYVGDSTIQDQMFYVNLGTPGVTHLARTAPAWPSFGNVATSGSFDGFSPDGLWNTFRADLDTSGRQELYLADLSGTTPANAVKLSGAFAPSGAGNATSLDFVWSPDSRKLIYSADSAMSSNLELWLVDVSSPGSAARVNGPMHQQGATAGDVPIDSDGAWSFSTDGARIAYIADQDVDTEFNLYVVDTSAPGSPTKLNAAFPAGANTFSSKFLWLNRRTIIYLAQQDPALTSRDEVYAIDVTAPPPAQVRISPRPAHAGEVGSIDDIAVSPDGTRVLFRGDLGSRQSTTNPSNPADELYLVEFNGVTPGAAVRISPPPVADFENVVSFRWSPDGRKVALVGDFETSGVNQLLVVDLSGPIPGGAAAVSVPATVESSLTTGYAWSPDSSHLAFRAGGNLFAVDVSLAEPGPVMQLNPTPPSGTGTVKRLYWSPDSAKVAYVADEVTAGTNELFVVELAAPGSSDRVNPGFTGTKSITQASVFWTRDSSRIVYRSNQDAPGTSTTPNRIFMSDLTTPFPFTNVQVSGIVSGSNGTQNVETSVKVQD